MQRHSIVFALLLSGAMIPALAQSVAPAPAPPAPSSPTATIKANAQLVIVDVVVTDKNLKPVHGLTAAGFTLTEDNVPQVVKHFEAHTALTAADATRFEAMPQLPPGIFTNYSPTPASGAVNILLLDTLNTPMADQAYVRGQLLAYLKSTPPGTRIAIFGLTTHLILLQGFTSDPEVLKTLLAKGFNKGSPLLDDQVGGTGTQNSVADDLEDNADPRDTASAGVIANLREFDAQQQAFQFQLRAQYTLDAMNDLARYLSNLPGRKNLIWFSGSFPLNLMPDGSLTDPFAAIVNSEDEFRDTVNRLARGQVAVYPIDARGLMTSPVFSATTTRNYTGAKGIQRMNQDNTQFFNSQSAEHGTMQAMAAATGGHAFVNTNGIAHAVAAAIDDGSNFYTLAYTPTHSEPDGKFRRIKVQLAGQGYTLSYRQGYYADDPDKLKTPANKPVEAALTSAAVTSAAGPTPAESMHAALVRGAPAPTEILIKVGVVPMNPADKPEDQPASGNQIAAQIHGPYRRYSVNYEIDPTQITFLRQPDGKIHADFDLIILVYDPNGALLNSQVNSIRIAAPLEDVRKMFARGFFHHQEISAPVKGEYFLRIAVHDLHRDRYGAVEVATSSVKNLVPPTLPATPPAASPPPPPTTPP